MLLPPGFGDLSRTIVWMLCERRVLAADRPARPEPITITDRGEAILMAVGMKLIKHPIGKWGLLLGSATTPPEYWCYCDANDICVVYEVMWHDRGLKGNVWLWGP